MPFSARHADLSTFHLCAAAATSISRAAAPAFESDCHDDRTLVRRWFRRTLYAGHPYGRSATGTEATLGALVRGDLARGRLRRVFPRVALAHDWFRLIVRADDPRRGVAASEIDSDNMRSRMAAFLDRIGDRLELRRAPRDHHQHMTVICEYIRERRANAVRQYLIAQGLPADRIKTISYGKERPEVVGSDEGAWARNRVGITSLQ